MGEQVVLIDKNDNKLGLMDKFGAHRNPGKLHRAISVLLWKNSVNGKKVLIQKRSAKKPLWPLFWSDTCSTHPRDGESYESCAIRRLKEEMGIKINEKVLQLVNKMYYQADYNEELSEHELDGLLVGKYEGDYEPNEDEVSDARWVSWEWLIVDLIKNKDNYVPWFQMMIQDEKIKETFK